MSTLNWHLEAPIDAVIFDCDSTLSFVEGITELAKMHDVFEEVHELTEEAMAKTGVNVEMYRKRLELVRPTKQEMSEVAEIYWQERTKDVQVVIAQLQALGKEVYVLSAGIQQSVELFANRLNIPSQNVFAVSVFFDDKGEYQDFDRSSSLACSTGKSQIVEKLRERHTRLAMVGDGMNDIEASSSVDRFIGYGGSCYRLAIAKFSPFYIRCKSMSPVLPLVVTETEMKNALESAQDLFKRGVKFIEDGQVEFRTIT